MNLISWIPMLICFSSPTALSQDGSICLIFFFNTDIVSAFSVLLIATSFSSKKLRKEHLKNILNKNASFKVIRKGQVENELVSEDNVSNLFLSVSSQVPDRSRNKRILNFVHFRKSPFI